MDQNKDQTILGAFFDDSNNLESRNSGIVSGVFSVIKEDRIFRQLPKRVPYEDLNAWLAESQKCRDYRFAELTNPELRRRPLFIPFFVPSLIESYLSTCNDRPKNINLYIDGILPREQKDYLKEELEKHFETVVVNNIIKREREMARNKKDKRIYAPLGLAMADILATSIYNRTFNYDPKKEVKTNQDNYLNLARSMKLF